MKIPSVTISEETLSNFDKAVNREWIITNGLGGYASSTVLGINTRKYHGLLVAALHPPGDRRVCLVKLDEEIIIGNDVYPLGANEFQNGIFPQGHMFLKEFSISPFPKYIYNVEGVEVQKTIFMPYEKNATIAIYNILNSSDSSLSFRVFPLINFRHFHSTTDRWKIAWEFVQEQREKRVDIQLGQNQFALMIRSTKARYIPAGKWVEKIYFREEAKRGETSIDDSYQIGSFEVNAKAREKSRFALTAVTGSNVEDAREVLAEMPMNMYNMAALYEAEMRRYHNLLTKFHEGQQKTPLEDWLKWMILVTDKFIVKGSSSQEKSVIAGYHWFESWGRDTFISLPGLMLVTRRFKDAQKIFSFFTDHVREGLIPNFISDSAAEPNYATVDATLWYVNAILQYTKYTADFDFVESELWEVLKSVVENHENGTAFNIGMDDDGLLRHGPQLTWMDAAVDGAAVTPRAGKAVEIQALWYNTLKTVQLLANKFEEKHEAEKYAQMAERTKNSFMKKFWNSEKEHLFDVIVEDGKDDSLRPNQVIAIALDFNMLDDAKREKIVDITHKKLLTPFGLRTLSKDDSHYLGTYAGDRNSRDKAYHNGTVWPWLLGPFTTAFLKAKGYTEYAREYALLNFLKPLLTKNVLESGLCALNEIFDGDPPHRARGCIAQAWSVAEPLRAYFEDILRVRPSNEENIFKILQ